MVTSSFPFSSVVTEKSAVCSSDSASDPDAGASDDSSLSEEAATDELSPDDEVSASDEEAPDEVSPSEEAGSDEVSPSPKPSLSAESLSVATASLPELALAVFSLELPQPVVMAAARVNKVVIK
jgi:hypothetical protein